MQFCKIQAKKTGCEPPQKRRADLCRFSRLWDGHTVRRHAATSITQLTPKLLDRGTGWTNAKIMILQVNWIKWCNRSKLRKLGFIPKKQLNRVTKQTWLRSALFEGLSFDLPASRRFISANCCWRSCFSLCFTTSDSWPRNSQLEIKPANEVLNNMTFARANYSPWLNILKLLETVVRR